MAEHLIKIEIEAESVERAQQLVATQLTHGAFLLSETVVARGGRQVSRASGDDVAGAFERARSRLPEGAEVLEEKVTVPPGARVVVVTASDPAQATALVRPQLGPTETASAPRVREKNATEYAVDVVQPAIVEISYRRRARLVAKIGRDTRPTELSRALDEAERLHQPLNVICEKCGRRSRALPKPMSASAGPVVTPELAMVASRYCEACNRVFCGACVGVTLTSVPPDFGGRKCPRCGAATDYAAICHLRMTDTRLARA